MASQNLNLSQTTTKNDPTNQQQPSQAYAKILSNTQSQQKNNNIFPDKQQAITMQSTPGILHEDYVIAISQITNPKNIIFYSPNSNGRICIYLNSKEEVAQIVRNYKTIAIKGKEIPIRSYVTPWHRIVIWIFPNVPHEVVSAELRKLGITPQSNLQFITAGFKTEI